MALHLLVMPIAGAGTQANPRAPKYVSSFDGKGWVMCDGGSYCTVMVDLSATALSTITANTDAVELPMTNMNVAPNAITASKVATIMNGTTVAGSNAITVPGGATATRLARIALEQHQPALVGQAIYFILGGVGSLTI